MGREAMKSHENGQLEYEENWLNNNRDGISKGWHENGMLNWEIHFKNDVLNGKYLVKYPNGQVRIDATFYGNKIREEDPKRGWIKSSPGDPINFYPYNNSFKAYEVSKEVSYATNDGANLIKPIS